MGEEEYTRLFVPYDFDSINGTTEGFAESLLRNGKEHISEVPNRREG